MQRIVSGALAGLVATMAMTMAMRRLHELLDRSENYPLPPREIIERATSLQGEADKRTATLAAHFGFGALAGAIFAVLPRRPGGMLYGASVWALSYFGWIPAMLILAPASRHPARRNLLMVAAHLVWGAVLVRSLRELEAAEAETFGRSPHAGSSLERQEMETVW